MIVLLLRKTRWYSKPTVSKGKNSAPVHQKREKSVSPSDHPREREREKATRVSRFVCLGDPISGGTWVNFNFLTADLPKRPNPLRGCGCGVGGAPISLFPAPLFSVRNFFRERASSGFRLSDGKILWRAAAAAAKGFCWSWRLCVFFFFYFLVLLLGFFRDGKEIVTVEVDAKKCRIWLFFCLGVSLEVIFWSIIRAGDCGLTFYFFYSL